MVFAESHFAFQCVCCPLCLTGLYHTTGNNSKECFCVCVSSLHAEHMIKLTSPVDQIYTRSHLQTMKTPTNIILQPNGSFSRQDLISDLTLDPFILLGFILIHLPWPASRFFIMPSHKLVNNVHLCPFLFVCYPCQPKNT